MKKLYTYLTFIFLLISFISQAQIITTSPAFPTESDEVTITFDATLGTGGLKDYTGDVYAHTGVITDKSTSDTDWKYAPTWGDNSAKYKLTSLENNKWELKITPSIREYYAVADGEKILKMAFVFRASDNSKEGKGDGGTDIFVDVSEGGLNVSFSAPANNKVIQKNEDLQVTVQSNASTNLSLFLDGVENETTTETEISKTINTGVAGNHGLVAVATDGSEEVRATVNFFVRDDVVNESMPANVVAGINYIDDTSVTLVLYAPNKEYVYAIGDFSDWKLDNMYQMKKDGDNFWVTINNLQAGKEYIFQYLIDGDIKIADPYADKISDPWNDKYITDETYPNLIDYPEGKTSEIASVFQTAQTAFSWTDDGFTMPKKEDLVVYELHVRDFTAAGNIKTVTDTLDYLERLGVNAIELMPFNEFEGNDSWGYNPSFYFAPDKAYGTKNDYKAFINECHKRGIAVLMDMVLNHTYGQSPFLRMYFDGSKPTANNPWYNQEHNFEIGAAHWGYDLNHDKQETKDLVDRINSYWMEEYHIDGFRFDFTKGFSNKIHPESSDPWGSQYDAARIANLTRMATEIWNIKSDAVVIFEHLSDNQEEKELAAHGILLWGNANHDYRAATIGNSSNFHGTSWKNRGWDGPKLVSYMESHDEERMMYSNLTEGKSLDGYNVRSLNTGLSRVETAAAFFLTIPGPKMIWQFGELGYDISINEGGRTSKKPVKWEYQDDPYRKKVYQVFSALAKIKKEEPAFESDNFNLITSQALKRIEINHADMDVRIIGNFDIKEGSISANFSKTGTWYDYFSGQELNVTDANANITLKPGEYHIYTTKQLTQPNVISAPVASNVTIAGTAKENETLTASYNYSDVNGDTEGASVYRWYRAEDTNGKNEMSISGATNKTYQLTGDDRDKYIRFSVTPVAQTGELLQGNTVYSSYTDQIVSLVNAPVASNVEITGTLTEGEILTASYVYSDPENDAEGTSIFQWYRSDDTQGTNESEISGATSLSYTLLNADGGKYIRFAVTPVAQTGELLTGNKAYSNYTDVIAFTTGIDDILEKELKLYPNPVKDILYLSNLKGVDQIKIYSLSGRMVRTIGTPNRSEEINLSNLASGMYLFIFEMEDGSRLTKKVIKK
ncbi:alpha-amylase family glycosyl hydrolase [Marinifilum flexuosum]|uniref:Putative secreted protein (Por secretion system target) n=1 Tax=Marinifilum flexuosum TaxID=1117708 RepID=A0A419X4N5_9BACT|nr:alpha-amylase family glycosyl hydrolase [Marinifilum flexuosum]RKE02570.1 putative secreted protein (Por secretion system target) [Marinifilum flexuosum]